jgi:hypothetical protein
MANAACGASVDSAERFMSALETKNTRKLPLKRAAANRLRVRSPAVPGPMAAESRTAPDAAMSSVP